MKVSRKNCLKAHQGRQIQQGISMTIRIFLAIFHSVNTECSCMRLWEIFQSCYWQKNKCFRFQDVTTFSNCVPGNTTRSIKPKKYIFQTLFRP